VKLTKISVLDRVGFADGGDTPQFIASAAAPVFIAFLALRGLLFVL